MGKAPQSMDFLSFVFWIGVMSVDGETLAGPDKVWQVSQSSIDSYVARVATMREKQYLYDLGEIPSKVLDGFATWDQECHRERKSGTLYLRGLSLMTLQLPDKGVTKPIKCPEELRYEELAPFYAYRMTKSQRDALQLVFYFDQRPFVKDESMFAIAITFSVMLLLCGAAIAFSLDADALVLNPVEKMISTVHRIRDRPLDAMKMADEEFKREEAKKARERSKNKEPLAEIKKFLWCVSGDAEEVMETVILEKTIIKIGSLLALGFGEAGASIIEHNMHGADSACVDAMVDGSEVTTIIGVARIRDFSTTTEVLQAKVMTFVNQIAEIVHGVVDEFYGAPNKNNGEIFLLVWRTQDSSGKHSLPLAKLADMSILAFTRITSAVHSSRVLEVYRSHPGLQQRLGKDCRVNLSFGLHYGWVIEGAVGSEFKIDASYLSPNVSIAESVERATQIYGVSILIAESLIEVCNHEMAAKCRLIDKVLITGSPRPMNLYVMDLDYYALEVEDVFQQRHFGNKQRFLARQHLEQDKHKKAGDGVSVVSLFDDHPEITRMRERYTPEFTHVFNMGYQNYSLGEWDVAQRFLHRTKTMLSSGNFVIEDGPSVALLRFMEHQHQFEAPSNWSHKAYRELGHAALS
jgi:class 3 adenylate cyclase